MIGRVTTHRHGGGAGHANRVGVGCCGAVSGVTDGVDVGSIDSTEVAVDGNLAVGLGWQAGLLGQR